MSRLTGPRTPVQTSLVETQTWYQEYYASRGEDRNSLLNNPGVLFQTLAKDVATIRAFRSIHLDPRSDTLLDVGCGEGASLQVPLQLGLEPSHLFGVDIQEERLCRAKARYPLVNFECADAACLRFGDNSFDIVTESTMFVQLNDENLARQVALEMIRVTKPGKVLLLSDWRYSKPGNHHYKGLSRRRMNDLFQVGERTAWCQTFRGSLIPPVGRFLSQHLPSAYFAVHALLPFLAGQVTTVLRKS